VAVDRKFHSHIPVEDDILLRWNHCQNGRSKITGEVPVQLVMKPGAV